MGSRQKPSLSPKPSSPEPPSLDGIALHDAKLLCKIILGALAVDGFFEVLYVPLVGPPVWFAEAFGTILFVITLVLGAAAALDVVLSICFHFRNRVRTKT